MGIHVDRVASRVTGSPSRERQSASGRASRARSTSVLGRRRAEVSMARSAAAHGAFLIVLAWRAVACAAKLHTTCAIANEGRRRDCLRLRRRPHLGHPVRVVRPAAGHVRGVQLVRQRVPAGGGVPHAGHVGGAPGPLPRPGHLPLHRERGRRGRCAELRGRERHEAVARTRQCCSAATGRCRMACRIAISSNRSEFRALRRLSSAPTSIALRTSTSSIPSARNV